MATKTPNQSSESAREAILEALIELTSEKAFSSITIVELCKAAGVSRMAFYRNYNVKEEVFSRRLDELVKQYWDTTAALVERGDLWYDLGHLTAFFEIMYENRKLVDSLFRCGFTWLLIQAIAGFLLDTWGNETPEATYLLNGFAGFLCSCYEPWAEGGFKEEPRQMAVLVNHFYRIPSERGK